MKVYQYSMQHPSITSIFSILKFPIQHQYLQLNISIIFEKGSKIFWRSRQLFLKRLKILLKISEDSLLYNLTKKDNLNISLEPFMVNLMKSHIMLVKSHDPPMINHMNYKDLFVRISQITKICSWESHELHRFFVNIFRKRNIWNRSWYEIAWLWNNTKSTFQIIKSF